MAAASAADAAIGADSSGVGAIERAERRRSVVCIGFPREAASLLNGVTPSTREADASPAPSLLNRSASLHSLLGLTGYGGGIIHRQPRLQHSGQLMVEHQVVHESSPDRLEHVFGVVLPDRDHDDSGPSVLDRATCAMRQCWFVHA